MGLKSRDLFVSDTRKYSKKVKKKDNLPSKIKLFLLFLLLTNFSCRSQPAQFAIVLQSLCDTATREPACQHQQLGNASLHLAMGVGQRWGVRGHGTVTIKEASSVNTFASAGRDVAAPSTPSGLRCHVIDGAHYDHMKRNYGKCNHDDGNETQLSIDCRYTFPDSLP